MASSTFSEILKKLRKSRSLTQEQVAEHLGVSPQAVSKWENGSYPDGDLIPRVAKFYGVSVSYLYGEEGETKSPEQTVYDYFRNAVEKISQEDAPKSLLFDRILNTAWAAHISPWMHGKSYYDRPVFDKDSHTVAVFENDAGFEFMSLNKDREFYTVLPKPENGFSEWVPGHEEMRRFFAMMGEKGALETIFFMLSLAAGEYVSASTVAETLKVDKKVVENVLETFASTSTWNGCIRKVYALNKNDDHEMMYGTVSSVACLLLSIFAQMNMIIEPPQGYQMQIIDHAGNLIEREKLMKVLK